MSGPVHSSVNSRHANYQLQYARGKTSLTNKFLATKYHPGHLPQLRQVVFHFLIDFQPSSI
jgi:hypothetical protein